MKTTRRMMLACGASGAAAMFWPLRGLRGLLHAADGPAKFQIGACDWSLGLRQKLQALSLAKSIGLQGVQVSFDGGPENDLRQRKARDDYAAESGKTGVAICSLAMGVLNKIPYATDPDAERWVAECIEVMAKMGQKVVLLAFFGNGDIKGKPELQKAVAQRLRKVAPAAEKAGVILGIESWLSADEHLRILDEAGSPNVQVWYDVANSHKMGYDIYAEIKQLKGRICQMHMKENSCLLGKGEIDFRKVRQSIEAIDYRSWLIIEAATDKKLGIGESYRQNGLFLRETFGV